MQIQPTSRIGTFAASVDTPTLLWIFAGIILGRSLNLLLNPRQQAGGYGEIGHWRDTLPAGRDWYDIPPDTRARHHRLGIE